MIKTARQLKDLIRNLSKGKSADAQILMRNYMMERSIEIWAYNLETDIKYRIDQLDGGTFQNLCDEYLTHRGYGVGYSLGMKTGTNKTAKGNPDTYFLTKDGKYIFVMYTTQKDNFLKKALEDLEKCFDPSKTGLLPENVAEVVYCHTYPCFTWI